jgi:hypothetical protein
MGHGGTLGISEGVGQTISLVVGVKNVPNLLMDKASIENAISHDLRCAKNGRFLRMEFCNIAEEANP